MVSRPETHTTCPGFSRTLLGERDPLAQKKNIFPFTLLLQIPMGLVDHPMGVAEEARLITVHTRTHIHNNILIFEEDELETYVSPQN